MWQCPPSYIISIPPSCLACDYTIHHHSSSVLSVKGVHSSIAPSLWQDARPHPHRDQARKCPPSLPTSRLATPPKTPRKNISSAYGLHFQLTLALSCRTNERTNERTRRKCFDYIYLHLSLDLQVYTASNAKSVVDKVCICV